MLQNLENDNNKEHKKSNNKDNEVVLGKFIIE